MSRRALGFTALGLGFLAVIVVGTLNSQNVECSVEVVFDGMKQSATASAENQEEAERQAVIAACGPIAAGMDNSIRCSNTPPVKRECRTL